MKTVLMVALAGLISVSARAGMFGGGPPDTGTEKLMELFGKMDAFSATAHTSLTDEKGRVGHHMLMKMALLEGNFRTEMDLGDKKGAKMSPEEAEQMKAMGMDKVVMLHRAAEDKTYMVYPGMKAYCEVTHRQAVERAKRKIAKVDKTEVGKDTIDGHACVRNKVVITYEDGDTREMMVWSAKDLKDFPIKTEMAHNKGTVTTAFRDIDQSKPDSSLFSLPSDYTGYGSMQEMMMANMQKMMGGMMPPGGMPPGAMRPPRGGEEQ